MLEILKPILGCGYPNDHELFFFILRRLTCDLSNSLRFQDCTILFGHSEGYLCCSLTQCVSSCMFDQNLVEIQLGQEVTSRAFLHKYTLF